MEINTLRVCDYVALRLKAAGVTDTFGIPGQELLDLIYSINEVEGIETHLCYHEQGAGYAACGYAQSTGKLGVAYGTKGPGVMNLITPIAQAYYGSFPVLFFTAHSKNKGYNVRIDQMKEVNMVPMLKYITKYAVEINELDDIESELDKAIALAMSGRKGPVFIDFPLWLLKSEIIFEDVKKHNLDIAEIETENNVGRIEDKDLAFVKRALNDSQRPVILIGDGVRNQTALSYLTVFSEKNKIPIVSSRLSQDLVSGCPNYFGYIGSHANRYAHFIVSKADLIISIGNRMAYPIESKSFSHFFKEKRVIRVDIDVDEFQREVPEAYNILIDSETFVKSLSRLNLSPRNEEWILVCKTLKYELEKYDCQKPILDLANLLNFFKNISAVVCDVGSNEVWTSKAYSVSNNNSMLMHSKFLEDLGCGLPKAIGASLGLNGKVLCIVGDQGIQFNLQEFQLISKEKLKVAVCVVNNQTSGIMKNIERKRGFDYYLHTTEQSGFGMFNLKKLAELYSITYYEASEIYNLGECKKVEFPCIIELKTQDDLEIIPSLPIGNLPQNMEPEVPNDLYVRLDEM